jgi:hypothetical protein
MFDRASSRPLAAGVALVAALAAPVVTVASDVLAQFRLSRAAAETHVFDSVWNDGLGYFGGVRTFKALSAEARATAVTAAAAFARAYCETDAFRARYAKERDASRPAPLAPFKTWAETQAEQKAKFDKSLAEMRANATKAAPEIRKMLEETADSLVTQQQAMDRDAALQAQMKKGHEMSNEMKRQAWEKSVKDFEQKHPEDPNKVIAARLRGFLAMSSDVPATAELVERDGKLRFADRKLEGKSYAWKQLFRAGKPAVDAARTAATEWLASLEGTK